MVLKIARVAQISIRHLSESTMRAMEGSAGAFPFALFDSNDGWTVPVSALDDCDHALIPGDLRIALLVSKASFADEACFDARFDTCPDLPVYDGNAIVDPGEIAKKAGLSSVYHLGNGVSFGDLSPGLSEVYNTDSVPEALLDRRGDTPLPEGNYLTSDTVWIGCGDVSVRVSPYANGVSVGVYVSGSEDEDPEWFAMVRPDGVIASGSPDPS